MVDEMSVAAADEAVVTEDMIAALKGRAAFYDLLAAIYFRPLTAEQIDNIAEMDWSEYADVNELFADGVNDITRYLRKRNSGTRQALAVDFTSAFAGTSSWKGRYAVPYESVHTSEEGLMMQDARDNVLHTYQQWGLRVPDEFDLPEDHITLEFDLMACLADRTRATLEADEDAASRTEEGDVCSASELIAAQRAFLDEHLSWVPAFCGDVEKHARTAFYYGIAGLTRQQLEADRETLRSI
jgi:TorA maturation chaperone TorD